MPWIEANLGDVLVLNYGFNLPEKTRVAGRFPVYGSNGIVGYHNTPLVTCSGVVVGRKGSVGSVHFSTGPFCPIDTTFFVTADGTELDVEFLYYLLRHLDLARLVGDVGVPGLNRESAYGETVRFPPDRGEQKRIAEILRTVEQAAAQQRRLAVLTAELKKAVASHLFARGVRGEDLKDDEVGQMPQSWISKPLGACCDIVTGSMAYTEFVNAEQVNGPDTVRCMAVKVADMNALGNELEFVASDQTKSLAADVAQAKLVPPRSAVFPKRGAAIATNKKRLTTTWTVLDPNLIALRPHKDLDIHFLFQWLQTFDLRTITEPGPTPQLNKKDLEPVLMPLPADLEEQNEIAARLHTLDESVRLINRRATLLRELFEALLAHLFDADPVTSAINGKAAAVAAV